MSLIRVCQALVSASFLLACGHSSAPKPIASAAEAPQVASEYVTLVPEVTYSRTGQDAASEIAPIAADEDVMANILAIPPGSSTRHAPCNLCPAEAPR